MMSLQVDVYCEDMKIYCEPVAEASMLFWRVTAAAILLAAICCGSVSAFAAGALAIDSFRGSKFGYAIDRPNADVAKSDALTQCGPGCTVVVTFENTCAAFAADQSKDSGSNGWGYGATKEQSQATALRYCAQYGGISCQVRVWACESVRAQDARAKATREIGLGRAEGGTGSQPLAMPDSSAIARAQISPTPPPSQGQVPPAAAMIQPPPTRPPAAIANAIAPSTVAPTPAPQIPPALAAPIDGSRRVALVVGNDAYENLERLQKAVNDARAVSDALGRLGFQVIRVENAPRRIMNQKISEFTGKVGRGDTAFMFYSGHGVEIRGINYLLATDTPPAHEGDDGLISSEGIAADIIIERLQDRGAKITMLVLDACRENPFKTAGSRGLGGTRGLGQMTAPEGVFVLYSAGVGQTALDRLSDSDPNPNSVFTRTLVQLLARPGMTVQEMAKATQAEVRRLAGTVNHPQMPAYYDQILGQFSLAPAR